MSELLLRSIQEKTGASPEELQECRQHFIDRKLRKRQLLLQEGEICNRLSFVEQGALYAYSTDAKGNRHVMQFAFEGWWIADLYSFFTQEPSRLNIEALEDSVVWQIEREQHHQLLSKVARYETYTRLLYQNGYIALQRRLESTLGLTAEERYSRLLEQHPAILNRVPLNLIASYLGVTPETLSRIRRQLSA